MNLTQQYYKDMEEIFNELYQDSDFEYTKDDLDFMEKEFNEKGPKKNNKNNKNKVKGFKGDDYFEK